MLSNSAVIHERSISIRIPKNSSSKENEKEKGEYSLKENIFDPFKGSPPNDFMTKLELRMSTYFMNK
jgi:hypothetical protein